MSSKGSEIDFSYRFDGNIVYFHAEFVNFSESA